jgi:RNA polymerase sigma-70 factor (ECF subfamily)
VGEIAGIEDLYRQHAALIYGYLLRRTRDRELAADLVQETFATATRALLGWRGGSAEGWLLAIARNKHLDHVRRTKQEAVLPTEDELRAEPLPAHTSIEIEDVLSRLNPDQARLLRLIYVDGFRPNEVAAATGRREGTVRMALARARQAFRDQWDADDE